ncbi:MAG TPA: TlyA family RNA methyltransferase [Clostridiales bacterium]|nr:TlyA family RNA methyltransferase [Clostridiales bacterium]
MLSQCILLLKKIHFKGVKDDWVAEKRLDIALVENRLASSRERAKEMIKSGQVTINGNSCDKPSKIIFENDKLEIIGETLKYAGRGGLKFEHALDKFEISVKECVCVDIGASTGGFTDCMLQNGAKKVYAVDVGHSQLVEVLKNNIKVVNMEKTDVRTLTKQSFNESINFIATDVSFISLKLVLPKIYELLEDNCQAVVLIKPQFEAGKSNLNKNGIVRDSKVHIKVLKDIYSYSQSLGFSIKGLCFSSIKGGKGNIEYLMLLEKSCDKSKLFDFKNLVEDAFYIL